jgi:translation initiation factor IF-3
VRVNEQIRIATIRLIDQDGEQVGIVPVEDARQRADDAGMDLVEVSPNATPPVCRIMNYGKYKYEITKKQKEAKKKRHVIHIKEIKMRPEISIHDFDFKVKHAREFLERGDKVKFTLMFRGRAILHKENGRAVLERVVATLDDAATVESHIRSEGRNLTMLMTPRP